MSATIENVGIPNPLRSTLIPPTLLVDSAEERIRDSTSFNPFAFIITKQHPTLPLGIHNYTQRSFWDSSPLSSFGPQLQHVIDSQTLSGQNEESLALTLASRSLVTELSTGRVVSRSFAKFFNQEEKMAYKPTGYEYAYEIQEKVDGSIINLFWYEPPGSRTGQWVVASRTSFTSPQTETAWNILSTRFPSLVSNTQESSLDKTKTYVFELVDNRMPIKILYEYQLDLILLSIFGRDGSETRPSNTGLPFRRPRMWKLEELITGENGPVAVTASNLTRLSKLHRANEEGFVIIFWRSEDDVHPQRMKVKLEDYLKLSKPGNKTLTKKSKLSMKSLVNGPPSPNALVDIYTAYRMSIPSLIGIDGRMASVKQLLLEAIRDLDVSDDYGGEAWLAKIMKIWDRIHSLFSLQEIDWTDTVKRLKEEGYGSRPQGGDPTILKQVFDKRISRMDRSITPSLRAWVEGQNICEIVKLLVEGVEVPTDLKSTEVISLH